jgi:HAD superfamily hydrolase (TIGR01450 family)
MRLADLQGFAFDLDGCVWAGARLLPGARDLLADLRQRGKRIVFLTNNSREPASPLAARLRSLGIEASPSEVVTALELLGEEIARRFGISRVLALGTVEMETVLLAAGHALVPFERWGEATVVAVSNDPAFDYDRLGAAARAVAAGAHFITVNLDPRLPTGDGDFLPGCGALTEAVAVAAGARPVVVGKPHPPIFRRALERLGWLPARAAMVGDSLDTDVRGGIEAGMVTIWVAPPSARDPAEPHPHLRVASLAELRERITSGQ